MAMEMEVYSFPFVRRYLERKRTATGEFCRQVPVDSPAYALS